MSNQQQTHCYSPALAGTNKTTQDPIFMFKLFQTFNSHEGIIRRQKLNINGKSFEVISEGIMTKMKMTKLK